MKRWARHSLALGLPMLGMLWLVESVAEPGKQPLRRAHEVVDDLITLVADQVRPAAVLPRHPTSKGHMALRKRTAKEKLADAQDGDKHLKWTWKFDGVDGYRSDPDAPNWSFNYYIAQRPFFPFFGDSGGGGDSEAVKPLGEVDDTCMTKLADGMCAAPCLPTDVFCDIEKKSDPMVGGGSDLLPIPTEKTGNPPIISDPIVSGGIGGGAGGGVGGLGAPVPEPSTWAMMILGFGGLVWMGWRHGSRLAV